MTKDTPISELLATYEAACATLFDAVLVRPESATSRAAVSAAIAAVRLAYEALGPMGEWVRPRVEVK